MSDMTILQTRRKRWISHSPAIVVHGRPGLARAETGLDSRCRGCMPCLKVYLDEKDTGEWVRLGQCGPISTESISKVASEVENRPQNNLLSACFDAMCRRKSSLDRSGPIFHRARSLAGIS